MVASNNPATQVVALVVSAQVAFMQTIRKVALLVSTVVVAAQALSFGTSRSYFVVVVLFVLALSPTHLLLQGIGTLYALSVSLEC